MKKKAYVLIFTLTILSLVTILTHQLLRTVYVGTHFDRAMIEREHSEMLALGGINLAIAQLTIKQPKEKGLEDKKTQDQPTGQSSTGQSPTEQSKEFKQMLKRVLPHLNRWQVFNLDEKIDGITGILKVCISSEHGKININEAFDFKKHEFKPEYQKFLGSLQFKGKEKSTGEFLKGLTTLLKKRDHPIDDLSELQTESLGNISQLFYEPPIRTKKKKDAKVNDILAINDIFTIWSKSDKLEALFLSDALCSILGLRRPLAYDTEILKEKFKEIIKNFDSGKDQNNDEYWKMIKPMYDTKSTANLAEKKIFSSKFEPTVYSVLSSGKVGSVEQKVLAIIEKVTQNNSQEPKDQKKKNQEEKKKEKPKQSKSFVIKRLYWI